GVEAPRPSLEPAAPAWLPRVLEDYRLILLDQRGTGRSTPLGLDTPAPGLLPAVTDTAAEARAGSAPTGTSAAGASSGTLRTADPAAAAEYLTHFRADAIVRTPSPCSTTWAASPSRPSGSRSAASRRCTGCPRGRRRSPAPS